MQKKRKESKQKKLSLFPSPLLLLAAVLSILAAVSDTLIGLFLFQSSSHHSLLVGVTANSINYGIGQQAVTVTNLLMPKLCQNQTVICEGSFCIPGVRKCVCDLRMPVQFGKYCLRQVDIETKCFVTNQCNHTVKDAVCIDQTSNAILNAASRALLKETAKQQTPSGEQFNSIYSSISRYHSNLRNSPYEINYNTPELLVQNHTRRKMNSGDKLYPAPPPPNPSTTTTIASTTIKSDTAPSVPEEGETTVVAVTAQALTTTDSNPLVTTFYFQPDSSSHANDELSSSTFNYHADSTTTLQSSDPSSTPNSIEPGGANRKLLKKASWPPGKCSCPAGFMFDSMLRKCLALSLADSHCLTDVDCKQIAKTHCSPETKKCQCDEPLVWEQKDLSCVRAPEVRVETSPSRTDASPADSSRKLSGQNVGFVENLIPPLVLAKLFPDYLLVVMIFIVLIIIAVLVLFKLTANWFSSSSSSALISPKNKKKKGRANLAPNNLPPRSPYATLRRPDHKPASQLSNFTQATRGRILNYDFEQEALGPLPDDQVQVLGGTLKHARNKDAKVLAADRSATLKVSSRNKAHKHHHQPAPSEPKAAIAALKEAANDQLLELNDNISLGQMESESENSVLAIPGPPASQQPPYMMASAMKGQGSAIAAAAAAVANRRMQMAQKKNFEQQQQQQQQQPSKLVNETTSPVFL